MLLNDYIKKFDKKFQDLKEIDKEWYKKENDIISF